MLSWTQTVAIGAEKWSDYKLVFEGRVSKVSRGQRIIQLSSLVIVKSGECV